MKFLIIGDGRVARHFKHYFELESLPHSTWCRRQSKSSLENSPKTTPNAISKVVFDAALDAALETSEAAKSQLLRLAESASHVLLLISDPAIESFLTDHPELHGKTLVHFSGIVTTPLATGAHPLMTFVANQYYSHETYRSIPFVFEEGARCFADLLPGLPNPSYPLVTEKKPLYHALCAMSGNFTTLLWEKVCREFADSLGLPKSVLVPYMRQTFQNLEASSIDETVLTGPLARGDQRAIARHLQALGRDPYREVYDAFVRAHAAESPSVGGPK